MKTLLLVTLSTALAQDETDTVRDASDMKTAQPVADTELDRTALDEAIEANSRNDFLLEAETEITALSTRTEALDPDVVKEPIRENLTEARSQLRDLRRAPHAEWQAKANRLVSHLVIIDGQIDDPRVDVLEDTP